MSRTLNLELIPYSEIQYDWNLNPCERDEAHILALAHHMNRDGFNKNFPLIVFLIEGVAGYQLACGFHRLEASQIENAELPNLPIAELPCDVRRGTWKDLVRCMNADNFKHTPAYNSAVGRAPSRTSLREMRRRLMLFPDTFIHSDRALASEWRCDHKAVGSIRDEIIEQLATGEFPPVDTPEYSFLEEQDIATLNEIIEAGVYRGLDDKMRKRTTAASVKTDTDNQVLQVRLNDAREELQKSITYLRETWQTLECVGAFRDFLTTAADIAGCDADTLLHLFGELEATPRSEKKIQSLSLKELETWGYEISTMGRSIFGYADWTLPFLSKDYLLGEWNTKWLSQLHEIFVGHGVNANSVRVMIGRAIKNDFGVDPYSMTAEQLVSLIFNAGTIVSWKNQPETWKRNRGQDIDWALELLSKAKSDKDLPLQDALDEMKAESAEKPVDVQAVQRDIEKAREKADAQGGMFSFRPIARKHGITEAEVGRIAASIAGSSLGQTSESEEESKSEAVTVADVLPDGEVLSIKLVCSGHRHYWFEDDSRSPDAIPLSSVPEAVLVNLLMLTQNTKRLEAAAGEFVRVFNGMVAELRLRDNMILYALERACTHYSCPLENLLMLTNLFTNRFDAEDAKTYRERMPTPHINAWINTFKSMKRDVETGENWMSGIKDGDFL